MIRMTDAGLAEVSVAFDLEYDGPALADHEMDVRVLAPALLSAGNLFQDLNRIAHPNDPPVAVNVKATSEGSFFVTLRILYDIVTLGLLSPDVQAGVNLATLLTGVTWVVNLSKNRQAKGDPVAEEQVEPGTVRVTYPDQTSLDVPEQWLRASKNSSVQENLREITKPLRTEGVEHFAIKQDDVEIVRVESDEVSAFEWGAVAEELIGENTIPMRLDIVAPSFTSNKWRLSDGSQTHWFTILDAGFLEAVAESRERFGSGDRLDALVRFRQYEDDERNMRMEREVVRVRSHEERPPPHPRLGDE